MRHQDNPARHQAHLLIPSAQPINQKKAENPEMRFNSQQMESYCLGLHTENPGLREVVTKSTCLNNEESSTKENKSYRTAWTYI